MWFITFIKLFLEVILVLVLWSLRPPNSGKELHVETGSAKQDNAQVGAKDYSNQQLWYNNAITLKKKIYLIENVNMTK